MTTDLLDYFFKQRTKVFENMSPRVKTLAEYPWMVALDSSDKVSGFEYASVKGEPQSYLWSVNTLGNGREPGSGC